MSLKSRAVNTALYKVLNIATGFIAQFILTPIILNGLGRQLYGVYTLINKAEGYLSFIDLRPSAILRYKLATLQGKKDLREKKQYVGASISLSFSTLPLILIAGLILSFFFPVIFNVDEKYQKSSQIAVAIISAFLAFKSFLGIPEAILRGNNLEYKGFFVEPLRYLIYGILVFIFLKLNLSLLGIIYAIVLSFIIGSVLKLIIQNFNCPGFFPLKPKKKQVKEFLNNGTWYLISSVGTQILNSFDIVLIGILESPEKVTIYALTKAILFRIGEATVTIFGSITAGVGDLISRNEVNKIIELRRNAIRYSIIIGVSLGAYFSCFNKSFVTLWVESHNYAGNNITLILCIALLFLVLTMTEEIFINALQYFKNKSLIVLQSSVIAVLISLIFYNKLGFIAIAIALVLSKIYQFIRYSIELNSVYPIRVLRIVKENFVIIVILLYSLFFFAIIEIIHIRSWFELIGLSMIFLSGVFIIIYFIILGKFERGKIKSEVQNYFHARL